MHPNMYTHDWLHSGIGHRIDMYQMPEYEDTTTSDLKKKHGHNEDVANNTWGAMTLMQVILTFPDQ